MIVVDQRSPTPPFEQVRAQLAREILDGALRPGERLPTVRRLAEDLGIAPNTVARAYRELEQERLVEARGRNGTVVAYSRSDAHRDLQERAADFAARARALDVDGDTAWNLVGRALGQPADADDGTDIVDVLRRLRDAWNLGDATRFAEVFSDDATFVTRRGDVLRGRPEIAHAHRELFGRGPSHLRVAVVDDRMLGDDTAVVVLVGGVGAPSAEYDNLQTLVLRRQDGAWRVTAFQNTAMSAQSKQRYTSLPER